jgi:hypothetical protein
MLIKRKGTKDITHLKTDNFVFENVENFNYLCYLNADNKLNTEIVERRLKGNKAYHANAKLIKSEFLKRNTKMKIYKKFNNTSRYVFIRDLDLNSKR